MNVPPRRRRRSHQATATVEFRDDVPDNAAAAADDRRDLARRRVSLKLDRPPGPAAGGDDDDEDEPGASGAMYAVAEGPEAVERPLSSGWAAALAAASAAGSVRAAAKRRTNVGRTNAFVPPPTRSTVPPPGPRAVARSLRRDSRPSRGLSSRNSDRHAVPPPPTPSTVRQDPETSRGPSAADPVASLSVADQPAAQAHHQRRRMEVSFLSADPAADVTD